jgi:arylsulfatase A-like enzyme
MMHDSPGDDAFVATAAFSQIRGDRFQYRAIRFPSVRAQAAAGGRDLAVLHDDPGWTDELIARPGFGRFHGDRFDVRAVGFGTIGALATAGDGDRAQLYDNPGSSDLLVAGPEFSEFSGRGFRIRASGFGRVQAKATPGDGDRATLHDDPDGADTFAATPEYARLEGEQFSLQADCFPNIQAHATPGSGDVARFSDDANASEVFYATPDLARLYGTQFDYRAYGFGQVQANSGGGGDLARLFGDPHGRDYFIAGPNQGEMRGEGFGSQVEGFRRIRAYSTPGESDIAVLYDAPKRRDTLFAAPEDAVLVGSGYRNQCFSFRYVHAYATPGRYDVAHLYDDAQAGDTFVATPDYGELSGDAFTCRAVAFRSLEAQATPGHGDRAVLYDSPSVDHIQATATKVRVSSETHNGGFINHALDFDQVSLDPTDPDDIHNIDPGAVDWLLGAPSQTDAEGPNVLFVALDDLNDWVGGLNGHPDAKTPNIDRLASRGMLFAQAHCPAPLCNPSRAAVLTGIHPTTSGVYRNLQPPQTAMPEVTTLPEHFMDHGYEVVGGGKIFHWNDRAAWHEYFPAADDPLPGDDADPDAYSRAAGVVWGKLDVPDGDMNDYGLTTAAAAYLAQPHDQPFFLAVGLYRPHMPWQVPRQYFDKYPLEEIDLPEVLKTDLDDVPPIGVAIADPDRHGQMLAADSWREAVQGYLASVSFADAQVGRLLDALDQGPNGDNTIVVLWSDHGWHLGEKQHWRKFALWEEATRTPLVFSVPGLTQPGSVSRQPVDLTNIYPTLADLCGLPVDAPIDGVSLRPLLEDPNALWDRPALTTLYPGNHAVRSERWRYIRYADGSEELYDHHQDPHEWTNLADDPALAPVKQALAAWLPETESPEAPYRPHHPFDQPRPWKRTETPAP